MAEQKTQSLPQLAGQPTKRRKRATKKVAVKKRRRRIQRGLSAGSVTGAATTILIAVAGNLAGHMAGKSLTIIKTDEKMDGALKIGMGIALAMLGAKQGMGALGLAVGTGMATAGVGGLFPKLADQLMLADSAQFVPAGLLAENAGTTYQDDSGKLMQLMPDGNLYYMATGERAYNYSA